MPFAPFASVDPTALRWLRRPGTVPAFDLSAGEDRVAELAWARSGGSLATYASSAGAWTLKRHGFLSPGIGVRRPGAADETARMSVHWKHHRIDAEGGRSYRFHRVGMLVPAWQVTDAGGDELIHVEPVREGRALVGGTALVSAPGRSGPDLELLLALSWYFIVLAWFEDEAMIPIEDLAESASVPGDPVTPAGSNAA